MAPGQWNGKNFGGCHTGDGKKQKTGHYFNNGIYHRPQPHREFEAGIRVVEKKTGNIGVVKEKKEKCPRSLIRVDFDGEVKYIRSNLLHTVDKVFIEQEKQFKKFKKSNERKKRPFVKNTSIPEFRKAKKEFLSHLRQNIDNDGGGVSIEYSDKNSDENSRGKYYINRITDNNVINDINKRNIEMLNNLDKNINNTKKMAVMQHLVSKQRLLELFTRDNTGSCPNYVPYCANKTDYYNIVNKYMNEGKEEDKKVKEKPKKKRVKKNRKVHSEEYIARKLWGL